MPIYQRNGKTYNIPDSEIDGFEKTYPDATQKYEANGKNYNIPVSERSGFLSTYKEEKQFGIEQRDISPAVRPTTTASSSVMGIDSVEDYRPAITGGVDEPFNLAKEMNEPTDTQKREAERKRLEEQTRQAKEIADEKHLNAKGDKIQADYDAVMDNPFSLISDPLMGVTVRTLKQVETEKKVDLTRTTSERANDTFNMVEEAKKKGDTNFVSGFGRGFWEKASKASTWDFGARDLQSNLAVSVAADKYANDQPLSGEEEALLDAVALEAAARGEFSGDLGRGYKAGSTTSESLPFMAEFMINPATGTGSAVGKAAAKRLITDFGKEAAKSTIGKIARGSARVAGDIAGASIMAGTTGVMRTSADAIDRMTGDVKSAVDSDGYYTFDGLEEGDDAVKSFAKAYGASTIENFSEMFGSYLVPMGTAVSGIAGRTMNKVGLGRVNDIIGRVKASDIAKVVGDFQGRTQWNGTIGEYLEEQAGMAMNALTVGDNSLSDLVDVDTQIDTFLGVSAFGGLFSGIKTAGYARQKYVEKSKLNDMDRRASSVLGEDWQPLKEQIDNADDAELASILSNTMSDSSIDDWDKQLVLLYAGRLKAYHGASLADLKRKTEGDTPDEIVQSQFNFDAGYKLAASDRNEKRKASKELSDIESKLDDEFLSSDEDVRYELMRQRSEAGEDVSNELSYINTRSKFDGMIQGIRDVIDEKVAQSNQYITRLTHQDGNVYDVTLVVDENKHVFPVNGVIVADENGIIDRKKSDSRFIVRDDQGNIDMRSADDLYKLESKAAAVGIMEVTAQSIREQDSARYAEEIDTPGPAEKAEEVSALQSGSEIELNLSGASRVAVVQNVYSDGGIELRFEDRITGHDGKEKNVDVFTADEIMTLIVPKEEDVSGVADVKNGTENEVEVRENTEDIELEDEKLNISSPKPDGIDAKDQENAQATSTEIIEEVGVGSPASMDDHVQPEVVPEEVPVEVVLEKTMESLLLELPKKKDGAIDYKAMTPRQTFEYTKFSEGDETAISDLQADIMDATEELVKIESKVSKAKGAERIELREQSKAAKSRLGDLQSIMGEFVPAVTEEEKVKSKQIPIMDADMLEWVADNSNDTDELLSAYNQAKETASHDSKLKPWEQSLLGRKVSTDSFMRFADRNLITGQLAKGWLSKDATSIDQISKEFEMEGIDVSDQDIVDFIIRTPSNYVRKTSDTQNKIGRRFSETASKASGMPIGSPESVTGRLFIQNMQQGKTIEGMYKAADEQSLQEDAGREETFFSSIPDKDAWTDEQVMEGVLDGIEYRDGEYVASSGMTSDEIDDIYSQLELNNDGRETEEANSQEDEFTDAFDQAREIKEPETQGIAAVEDREDKEGYSRVGGLEKGVLHGTDAVDSERTGRSVAGIAFPEESGVPAHKEGEGLFDYAQRVDDSRKVVQEENTPISEVAYEVPSFVAPEIKQDEDVIGYAERVVKSKELYDEQAKVNTEPSDAQKEAGNYKMGHVKIGGHELTIENPKGSVRRGVDADGKAWETPMNNTYGYFRGTKGNDGDHIDAFLGDNLEPENVYVVDQVNEDGSFDEHKVMYGFESEEEARVAYLSNYEDGWQGLGGITGIAREQFDEWLGSKTKKSKPFAEYEMVQQAMSEQKRDTATYTQAEAISFVTGKAMEDAKRELTKNGSNDIRYRSAENDREDVVREPISGVTPIPSPPSRKNLKENIPVPSNPQFTSNNVAKELHDSSSQLMRFLAGRSSEFGLADGKIDMPKAKAFYDDFKGEAKAYKDVLDDMFKDSSLSARELLKETIDDVDYALDYYKQLANNEDVWMAEGDPRFGDVDPLGKLKDKLLSDTRTEGSHSKNDQVNEQFNVSLNGLTEDNADSIVLNLGTPSDALIAGGIKNKPIKLYGSKIIKKMKKHGFELNELKNLPDAVAHPIAVFENKDRNGNRSVLTELRTNNGNFLVAIDIGKGQDADFDIVSSLFGKNINSVVNWINNGSMGYVDKEKALEYLHLPAPIAEASNTQGLSSATKIINDFKNPTIEEGEIGSTVEDLSEILNTSIRIVRNVDDITDTNHQQETRKRASKGWFDPKSGEVVVVLPNASSVEDVQATVLHEVVAHKGLREMFGKGFDSFLDKVYRDVDGSIREKITSLSSKHGLNVRVATEEYLAGLAERGFEDMKERSVWDKVKGYFKEMLSNFGIKLPSTLSNSDLRYILWRSYENQVGGGDIVAKAKDAAMRGISKADILFREEAEQESEDIAKREYEDALDKTKNRMYRWQEAYQDSMFSLKKMQEAIEKESGEKLQYFEDAYMAENQMSSKSGYETDVYKDKFFIPMMDAVRALVKNGAKQKGVTRYVMAKHGLERNVVFAKRDAEREAEDEFRDELSELNKLWDNGEIELELFDERIEELNARKIAFYEEVYQKNRMRDYSGLKQLTGEEENFEDTAMDLVDVFENAHSSLCDTLWEKVNASTKQTLKKSYESGLMTKSTYDKVRGMFEYYVPLRGWDDKVASDVYEYVLSERSVFQAPVKTAFGRESLADDPFANIGNMAESGILQGNRNLMKQKFLNMVLNHPTSLATVKTMWYEKTIESGEEEWKESFPKIKDNYTADDIDQAIKEHESRMIELQKQGIATKSTKGIELDYRASKKEVNEHIVVVKSGGKEYVIFVNGNPRAAQAINGLTNPDATDHKFMQTVGKINRQLAANFTTRNPAFVLSNMTRDVIFSTSAIWVKENWKYAKRFDKNIAKNIGGIVGLMARYKSGKLDMRNQRDRYFLEFLENGGETGYTALHNVEEFKKMMNRHVGKPNGPLGSLSSGTHAIIDAVSFMNRCAENVSRFTTYQTSREMGRGIVESVRDAKEVTVNFNKKGAGGLGAGTFKSLFLFFNAAVQSLSNFKELKSKSKTKFYTTIGGFATAGILMPMINNAIIEMLVGDDDDEMTNKEREQWKRKRDSYDNLPEWVRKNNFCLWVGGEHFITIPLPIELRAFYGLGEMWYQMGRGNMNGVDGKLDAGRASLEMVNQLTELLPINPLGGNGDALSVLVPDAGKPFYQVMRNRDFFGKPIYKKNDYNELMPAWTKAFSGTAKWMVNSAEFLNEVSGGDKYTQGGVDLNPATIEHVFEGYFGGMGKTTNQLYKTLSMIWDEDERMWRNAPVANRFFTGSDNKISFRKVNDAYYQYLDEYKETEQRLRGYENEAEMDIEKYAEKYDLLNESKQHERYLLMKEYKTEIDAMRDAIKESGPDEKKEIEMEMNLLKMEMIEELGLIE